MNVDRASGLLLLVVCAGLVSSCHDRDDRRSRGSSGTETREVGSFDATECVATGESDCEAFDQLIGSRMAVAGAEFRLPLMALFDRRAMYGALPVEIGLFADAGVAWNSDVSPGFAGGDRDWVRSVGAVLRFNAFGFAVGELDYVKPLDRPERGWMWQFNLTRGF